MSLHILSKMIEGCTGELSPGGSKFQVANGPFFKIPFCMRMLKNKAQIARESIKTTLELPGPLSGPWTPAESEFGSALIMCVRAHLLRPPPPFNEKPGSAPTT